MPDIFGGIVGLLSLAALFCLYDHLDMLSDGNVGDDDDKA